MKLTMTGVRKMFAFAAGMAAMNIFDSLLRHKWWTAGIVFTIAMIWMIWFASRGDE